MRLGEVLCETVNIVKVSVALVLVLLIKLTPVKFLVTECLSTVWTGCYRRSRPVSKRKIGRRVCSLHSGNTVGTDTLGGIIDPRLEVHALDSIGLRRSLLRSLDAHRLARNGIVPFLVQGRPTEPRGNSGTGPTG